MWVLGLLADTQCVTDGQTDETCASCKVLWPARAEYSALQRTNEHFVFLYPSNGAKTQMDIYRTDWYFL